MEALTSAQVLALTTDQIPYLTVHTPIILDLDGNGVQTISITRGIQFDINADSVTDTTGWVDAHDGLLVMDRNHDGAITDGSELFGSATRLRDGSLARDGYIALADLDLNHDGQLNSNDAAFAELRVWVDANSDGRSDVAEIQTLDSLGIRSIAVEAQVDIQQNHGNIVGLVSHYQTADGESHAAADVWFVANTDLQSAAVASAPNEPVPQPTLPNLVGAMVETLKAVMSNSASSDNAWSASAQTSSLATPGHAAWGQGPVTNALETYARQSGNAMAVNPVEKMRNGLSTTAPGGGETPLFSTPK